RRASDLAGCGVGERVARRAGAPGAPAPLRSRLRRPGPYTRSGRSRAMTSTATVHPVDPPSSTVNPVSTGRFDLAELTALAMTIVIGAGAFAWSFAALTDLAVMAGITPRLAWAGPIFVDGAIVQSAVALVSLQRRARQGVVIPLATKAFFWGELFAAEA